MSQNSPLTFDLIIIGAGAAGLMAAASAASRNKNVLLIEKNKKLGVKILMSGGTRCNITHACDSRGIIKAFGRGGKFLHSALAALPPQEVVKKIEAAGVETKTEVTGKIFPVSNKAIDVRDALVSMVERADAKILNSCSVIDICLIEKSANELTAGPRFTIETDQGNFQSKSVLITTGGKSYPGCGTTGDGYAWARKFGHSIVQTFPALTPITTTCEWAQDLKGVTIDPVGVEIHEVPEEDQQPFQPGKKSLLFGTQDSFLFTHWGFSGPSVLDASSIVTRYPNRKRLRMLCDFLPLIGREELMAKLMQRKQVDAKQQVGKLLMDYFPKRLAEALLVAADIDLSQRNADISKKQIQHIVAQLKATCFEISGTLGFEKAEVTTGGVNLKEVESKTMSSKLLPGLYLAGEILDLDGPIGGFNFQSAFSTGWLAGQSI